MPNTHSTLTGLFSDIANAIRAKTGGSETIVADMFPDAIAAIPEEWDPENMINVYPAHSTLANLFSDVADAIREKTGESGEIIADNFPDKISEIITAKTPVTVPTPASAYIYNGSAQSFVFNNEPSGAIAVKSGDTSGTNAGQYTTRFTLLDTRRYEWADGDTAPYKDISIAIEKVTPTITTTPVARSGWTYDKSSYDLLTDVGAVNYGTLMYSADNGSFWDSTPPTGKNAGSYSLWYRVDGDSNVNSILATYIGKVTVAKASSNINAPANMTIPNGGSRLIDRGYDGDTAPTLSSNSSPTVADVIVVSPYYGTYFISIQAKSVGTTTVKLAIAAGTNYKSSTASFTITVTN